MSIFKPSTFIPKITTSLHRLVGSNFSKNLAIYNEQNCSDSLVTVEINKEAILHNYNWYLKLIGEGRRIAPVLKSNAYGHGLVETAKILESIISRQDAKVGVEFFTVDSMFEAYALRAGGIHTKILVLGFVDPKIIARNTLPNVIFMITSLEQARALVKERTIVVNRLFNKIFETKIEVHIKVNTGMNRQGIRPEEVDECIAILTHLSLDTLHTGIKITGFASHFAEADSVQPEISSKTIKQISTWNSLVKILRQRPEFSESKAIFHISNTAGTLFTKVQKVANKNEASLASNPVQVIDADVCRIGIGLFGYSDIKNHEKHLIPALSMHTIISGIYNIKIGDSVGYSSTWVAKRNSIIATIPAGYYEGIDRRLSNKGFVTVFGYTSTGELATNKVFKCPIIGRVSMNITTIDITDAMVAANNDNLEIKLGSKVNILDSNFNARDMGNMCDTIPYEILVHIQGQLKRIYK